MKTLKLSVPISMTVALAGLIVCAASCAKKDNVPPKAATPPPQPPPAKAVTDNTTNSAPVTNAAPVATAAVIATNIPAVPQEITNPPPAETTTKVPETIAMTDTNLPGHTAVIEMPTNAPVAPTNFYPVAMTAAASPTNMVCCLGPVSTGGSTNFFFRFQGGYDHFNHGDNHDSYRVGAKFYAYGDGLRESAGKNGWLIPDATAEISSGYVAKPDYNPHPGSDEGLDFRADFTWPWIHWTSLMFARTNSVCPFCQPLALSLGPTVNVGFDHLYDESKYRFARYAGLRLTFNRSGFIEYTVGDTIGLSGTRQQVVAEIPFYQSRDGEVRYYVRGLWNRGDSNKPDILEGGLFLEMPFTTLLMPEKWGDLVPFGQ